MINFQFKKLLVSFRFTFFAVIALLLIINNNEIVMFGLVACLIHEAGHLTAIYFCREKVDEIIFYGAGIRIETERKNGLLFKNELFILLGGVFANFLCAICFFCIDNIAYIYFYQVNLLIAVFNLLPIDIFDGGKIRDMLISRYIETAKYDEFVKKVKWADIILYIGFIFFLIISGNRNPGVYLSLLFFASFGNRNL